MCVNRETIIVRGLTGRCPRCGRFGLFRHWFRLKKNCSGCGLLLEKEESGFYFGTTSIGYVLAILLVLIPVCVLVVLDILSAVLGITLAIVGSVMLVVALYPALLSWVLMSYYVLFPERLKESNAAQEPSARL